MPEIRITALLLMINFEKYVQRRVPFKFYKISFHKTI
jgi:hypothetical protein